MSQDRFTDDCSPNDATTEEDSEREASAVERSMAWEALEDKLAAMQDERDEARAGLVAARNAVEPFLAEGRPHTRGAVTGYPDGCECPLCEHWDALNRAWQAIGD